jgi:hypothetical protein
MERLGNYGAARGFGTTWCGTNKMGSKSDLKPGAVISYHSKKAIVQGNATWADVWLASEQVMDAHNPGPRDHNFIEGHHVQKDGTWELLTGS